MSWEDYHLNSRITVVPSMSAHFIADGSVDPLKVGVGPFDEFKGVREEREVIGGNSLP